MPCACRRGREVLRHICRDTQGTRFILPHSALHATLVPSYQQSCTKDVMNGSVNLINTFSPDFVTHSE